VRRDPCNGILGHLAPAAYLAERFSSRLFTALASVPTAILLVRLIPPALRVPNHQCCKARKPSCARANNLFARMLAGQIGSHVDPATMPSSARLGSHHYELDHGGRNIFGLRKRRRSYALLRSDTPDRAPMSPIFSCESARVSASRILNPCYAAEWEPHGDVSATLSPNPGRYGSHSRCLQHCARHPQHRRAEKRLAPSDPSASVQRLTRAIGERQTWP